MTSLVGRPPIPGHPITLRMTDAVLSIVDEGVDLQASIRGKAPSRAAWFREMIDFTFKAPLEDLMSVDRLPPAWPPEWLQPPHKVTMKIEDNQRILLRQFECHVQSLDWSRETFRNEAALLLIETHGQSFNRSLEARVASGAQHA